MFNLVKHTEDDGRIVVLYGLIYFVKTKCVEVGALMELRDAASVAQLRGISMNQVFNG